MKSTSLIAVMAVTVTKTAAQDGSHNGPIMSGTPSNCNAWYIAVAGDTCYGVENRFGITADQFLAWNPAVSRDCLTNFWIGDSYCIGVGLKETHSSAEKTSSTASQMSTAVRETCSADRSTTAAITSSSTRMSTATAITSSTTRMSTSMAITSSTTRRSTPATIIHSTPRRSISTTLSIINSTAMSSTPTKKSGYSTRFPITSRNITAPTSPTAWPPTKTQAGEPSSCNNWHYVAQGDTCQSIVNRYGNTITMKDFLAWNPAVKSDCSALFNGWYVCIAVKPTTSSSFDWFNVLNTVIPSPTPWAPAVLPTINSSFTATPQQSGISSSCQNFWKASSNDTCNTALQQYPYLTKEEFFKWNPALKSNCQGLWGGYWYCVANYARGYLPQPPTTTKPGSPKGTDTIRGCKLWYQADDDDSCDLIAQAFGSFSKSDFISWNPSVNSDCSNIQDTYYYCVGVDGTPTTRTSSIPATKMSVMSIPTQSGVASACSSYWLVSSSDTCERVTGANNIDMDRFVQWNPAVNSTGSCVLSPGVNVCVGMKN